MALPKLGCQAGPTLGLAALLGKRTPRPESIIGSHDLTESFKPGIWWSAFCIACFDLTQFEALRTKHTVSITKVRLCHHGCLVWTQAEGVLYPSRAARMDQSRPWQPCLGEDIPGLNIY